MAKPTKSHQQADHQPRNGVPIKEQEHEERSIPRLEHIGDDNVYGDGDGRPHDEQGHRGDKVTEQGHAGRLLRPRTGRELIIGIKYRNVQYRLPGKDDGDEDADD